MEPSETQNSSSQYLLKKNKICFQIFTIEKKRFINKKLLFPSKKDMFVGFVK